MKRALAVVGVAFLLFVIGGILFAGKDETTPPPDSTVRFGKGHAAGRRIETRSWSCEYDKIVANNDQSLMEVEGVHDGVIFRDGKPYLRLSAQHLTANMLTHDFSATGKLHVETADRSKPRSFDTDALTWNEAAQTLSFTRPLTFVTASEEPLRIGSLVYDVRAGTLHVGKIEGALKL
jgi:hypothetical protein